MRAETIYCSVLLILSALLAFQLPGSPVAAPASGVFIVLFLATLATGKENARKLRYIYGFFLGLISAAANKGSFEHVSLAVVISVHFLTWTEGFTATRRYAIKNGEPLPPDGRRGIYSLAFCAAILLSYLYLDSKGNELPLFLRGLLGFVAIVCGFALWDIGYVTRLQRATRFRRHPLPSSIRAMQWLVIAAVLVSLFLIFGRAVPSTAHAIHGAASELKKGTKSIGDTPLAADRDRTPELGDWQLAGDLQSHPHKLPAEGKFRTSQKLLLAMEVPDPSQKDQLLASRVYIRGYALYAFADDEWMTPDHATGKILIDAHDGTKDGRTTVDSAPETRPMIRHSIDLLEPFQRVLPALQGVHAYHLDLLHQKQGSWHVNVDPIDQGYIAESSPSIYTEIGDAQLAAGTAGSDALIVPETALMRDMRRLVDHLRTEPLRQRIDSIVELLDQRCDYSLSIANPGKFPALQNFLYGEKEGTCIHYATAAALLLRLVDVPARVAFGFSGGEYYEDEDVFAFRGQDAHVWVEVLLRNHGWTVIDPTPTEEGAAHPPKVTDAPQDYLDRIYGTDSEVDSNTSGKSAAQWIRQLRSLPWGTITVVMLGIIFFIAFLISWRQKKHESQADKTLLQFPDAHQEQPRYLREFLQMCSKNFGVQKSRSETLNEFIDQLKRAGALKTEFDPLRDYHYNTNYCDISTDKQQEEKLRRTIKDFAANRASQNRRT